MTPIPIPAVALEASAIALHARWVIMNVQDGGDPLDYERWEGLEDEEKQGWRSEARAAAQALLSAWPGMSQHDDDVLGPACIILPLPQED